MSSVTSVVKVSRSDAKPQRKFIILKHFPCWKNATETSHSTCFPETSSPPPSAHAEAKFPNLHRAAAVFYLGDDLPEKSFLAQF